MRVFFELTKRSIQRYLTYRSAVLAGLATNFLFGLLRVAIILALFGGRDQVAEITTAGVITYTALTQAVIGYLSLFSWFDLMLSVYSGEIATDLLKPISLFRYWLAQDLGRAIVNFFLRGITLILMYELIYDLTHPKGVLQWLVVICFIIFSWLVSFTWRFLINLAAFWTPNAKGILRFGFVFSLFFSGFLMPLRFFPSWVISLGKLTPFPYMLNTTVEVYLGLVSGQDIIPALINQTAWIIGLLVLSHIVLRAGVKRLVILGG